MWNKQNITNDYQRKSLVFRSEQEKKKNTGRRARLRSLLLGQRDAGKQHRQSPPPVPNELQHEHMNTGGLNVTLP